MFSWRDLRLRGRLDQTVEGVDRGVVGAGSGVDLLPGISRQKSGAPHQPCRKPSVSQGGSCELVVRPVVRVQALARFQRGRVIDGRNPPASCARSVPTRTRRPSSRSAPGVSPGPGDRARRSCRRTGSWPRAGTFRYIPRRRSSQRDTGESRSVARSRPAGGAGCARARGWPGAGSAPRGGSGNGSGTRHAADGPGARRRPIRPSGRAPRPAARRRQIPPPRATRAPNRRGSGPGSPQTSSSRAGAHLRSACSTAPGAPRPRRQRSRGPVSAWDALERLRARGHRC